MVTLKNSIALGLALVLSGCGDDSSNKQNSPAVNNAPPASTPQQANPEISKQPALQPQVETPVAEPAKAPEQPKSAIDVNTTNDKYVKLESGTQLAFWNYAVSGKSTDYEELANIYSDTYRNERDTFKKHDLLNILKPKIDAELINAKEKRYFIDERDFDPAFDVKSYNFDSKSFDIQSSLSFDSNSYRYFNDASKYKYLFSNGSDYPSLLVQDVEVAKKIEAMRSKYEHGIIKIYAYADSVSAKNMDILEAKIIRVEIYDKAGKVLLHKQ
jgi:hypothetical protein